MIKVKLQLKFITSQEEQAISVFPMMMDQVKMIDGATLEKLELSKIQM